MSQTGLRRTRDKLLFALAYGAVIAAVLFLHPVPEARDAGKLAANVEAGAAPPLTAGTALAESAPVAHFAGRTAVPGSARPSIQPRGRRHDEADMLTNKGKYGLKAMLYLARLEPGASAMGQEIATANHIPKKFLDAILLELRNAGMLRSKKGPGGGYALAKTPREIRIGHIIRVLDGPLAPLSCASKSAYVACDDCEDLATCSVRITMSKVRDAMSDILDGMSLHDMVIFSHAPNADLMYSI